MKKVLPLILLLSAAPSRAEEHYSAPPPPPSGRFLLLDREDPASVFPPDAEEEEAGQADEEGGLDRLLDRLPVSDYSQERWNKVRGDIETGRFQREEPPPLARVAVSTDTPLSPPPELEFRESGTTLSLTGRKVIGFNYSGKRYMKEQTTVIRPRSLSLFEISQQLQVRMQGKVGQKITVNVDYDDTKEDRQDISVVYQGDPNEVVQNVSFGDIDLSLPSTEFVSYNKQLFGIRADLRAKGFALTFIGSRTKGQTKVKQYTGNTQFQTVDVQDVNYLRRRYYDVAFRDYAYFPSSEGLPAGRLPIKPGSEAVYIDRQSAAAVDNITISSITADDLALQTTTYSGRFQRLSPGIDYTMDYSKGILTFSQTLNVQDVVIIDYVNANGTLLSQNTSSITVNTGGTGRPKLVKTRNDAPVNSGSLTDDDFAAQAGWNREIKTYYSIGQTNLVRDDGRGSFTLKLQDFNRNEVSAPGTDGNPVKYPDNIEVDFEQGVFKLKYPFQDPELAGTADRQIYSAAPAARRLFRVEYSYRFKTFLLEPSIVVNSEIVTVDKQRLRKNEEYFIDYDSGFITFYYPDRIGQNSNIEISYEVSPFGGAGNLSLVGGRVSYDFGSRLSLGSSLLYQGGIKANAVPSVTDLTSSMFVYEGDVQLKNLNILGLRMTLGGEIAQSRLNPNLNDYALVDNMEGVKQEDAPSMDRNFWFIAANPPGSVDTSADPTSVAWNTAEVKARDINPSATSDGTQQVLSVSYDFTLSNEVSIVYPLSATGLDFTQKTALELVLQGQGAGGPEVNLHFGQIDEDADGRGGQNFACSSGLALFGAPKSEDLNCDGQLSSAEDIGWEYAPAGKSSTRYGANNGRIDSADLNRNGRLDPQDFSGGSFGYVTGTNFTDTTDSLPKNAVDSADWRTWNMPLFIASTETYKWNAIKQVRLTLRKAAGGSNSGTVRFARIAAVGNTWTVQQSTATGTLQLLGVNNIDNPGYVPIYSAGGAPSQVYNDLYGSVSEQRERTNSSNVSEQALSVSYNSVVSTSTVYAYRKFPQALDISQHEEFRFLLYDNATPNASFYLKIGDENSYFKASVAPAASAGWRLITLRQEDVNGDKIPDVWTNASPYAVEISSRGNPSLQQVSGILIGAETASGQQSGTFYLNEIHLAKPLMRIGEARKAEASFEIPGWMSFGGKHRETDRNFQTPVSVISNQDNEQQTAYLNFNRLSFFPLAFTGARQVTVTPNTYVTGGSSLVTLLQQGRVKKLDGTAAGNLSLGGLPRISLNYAGNRTEYDLLKRDDSRDVYSGALTYSPPLQFFLLPRTLSLTYSLTSSRVDYRTEELDSLDGLYRTEERVDAYGARLNFVPWRGSTFNPSYNLQETREKKDELFSGNSYDYPKARQQTVDFNSNFLLARWFNPAVNYSVTTMENNNIVVTTVTVVTSSAVYSPGEIKTVNRTAQGGVSLNFSVNDLAPRNRLLRSLVVSSNFQIQDGDSWQNVERDYDTANKLWVRESLRPRNALALRSSLTTRDTFTSNQRWQPLEGYALKGRLAPLSTISITNNFSSTYQKSDVTGTRSRVSNRTFPDAIISISKLEVLAGAQSWARNATMNVKYSNNTNETRTISLDLTRSYGTDLRFRLLEKVDAALSYNHRFTERKDLRRGQVTQSAEHHDATVQGTFDYRKFRFTPKVDYSLDYGKTALGVVNQDLTVLTPSLLIKTDFQAPKGLRLPFMKQAVVFSNRIVWTTTLSYAIRKSPVVVAENNKLFSMNTTADYEAAKNLRLAFNASVQRLWHKYLHQEDYLSYTAGSTLTFQF